jgi:protein MpaA
VPKTPKLKILIIGGTHGVEPQSSYYAEQLAKRLDQPNILIIPTLNPDGIKVNTRGNARGVDLNRNLPSKNWQAAPPLLPNGKLNPYYGGTKPASEPENKKLIKAIEEHQPQLIISFHTNHYVQNPNPPQVNLDILSDAEILKRGLSPRLKQRGRNAAALIAEVLALPVTEDIGYATPGSLGSYSKDLAIPCITVEFNDELHGKQLWEQHGEAFVELLQDL